MSEEKAAGPDSRAVRAGEGPDGQDGDRALLLAEEERKVRRVRLIADLTLAVILQEPSLTPGEAEELVEAARKAILELFPDKERAYLMLYAPRFARAIAERWPTPDPCDTSCPA